MHVIVVTGYSRGLGLALVEDMQRRRQAGRLPSTFVFVGRREPAEASLAEGDVFVRWDLGAPLSEEVTDQVRGGVAPHVVHGGRMVLVYAAGVLGPMGPQVTPSSHAAANGREFVGAMNVNAVNFALLSGVVEELIPDTGASGLVFHLSSGAALRPYSELAAYCASKAAALMYARCLATRHEPSRICVLSVAPGTVRTDMTVSLAHSDPEQWPGLQKFRDLDRTGGLVPPGPVASQLVSLMLDDESRAWRERAHGRFYDLRKPDGMDDINAE